MLAPRVVAELPNSSRLIGIREVMRRTSYSKSKIYRLIAEKEFPHQAKKLEGSTSALWFEDQIESHLQKLRNEPAEAGGKRPGSTSKQSLVTIGHQRRGQTMNAEPDSEPVSDKTRSFDRKPLRSKADFPFDRIVIDGRGLYYHAPTGKLFMEIGQIQIRPEAIADFKHKL